MADADDIDVEELRRMLRGEGAGPAPREGAPDAPKTPDPARSAARDRRTTPKARPGRGGRRPAKGR